ncbi:MAG: acetate--CoA ligase family protein [Rhodospirillaceae bacterium]
MDALDRLIRPRSIAIVGASADPARLTGRPLGYLLKHGFAGDVWPVNPRATEIAGLPCFPDIAMLPAAPDVGLVLVGADRAEAAVRDLAERGAAAAIVLAGGYGESGAAGRAREAALKAAAGSMRLLGPNTIGLVNVVDRITLSASGALEIGAMPAGRVSVVSQSGGILGALLSRAADRGIGLARLVATGNEADIDTSEMIAHLAGDDATGVIVVYMEGLRRPDAFRAAAQSCAEAGKKLVVYKVGRSAAGARAATTHTGALAGEAKVYDALFRQCGAIRAETFADLLDVPAALAAGRRMTGDRVAILTTTGGAATLVADACGAAGLDLSDPDAATAARLATLTGTAPEEAAHNPVDLTLAGLKPDLMRDAVAALLDSPAYDGVVVVAGASALGNPTLLADAVTAAWPGRDRPVIAYVSPHAPEVVRLLNARGIPATATPEACAPMLQALRHRAPPLPAPAPYVGPPPPELPAGPLNEAESKALFARYGVPMVREIVAADAVQAADAAHRLGGRVALKVLSRRIAHKADVGGVRLDLAPADVADAAAAMTVALARAGAPAPEGFVVQEYVSGGVEMIVGVRRDRQLGAVLLVGAGGALAEIAGDSAIRLLPVARADVEAMLGELKAARLLAGYRGRPAADVPALVDAVMAFAAMAAALGGRLAEAEINPLLVLSAGHGVRAADGLAVIAAA